MEIQKKYIRTSQLQAKLDVTNDTIRRMVKRGLLPKPLRLSKTLVLWDEQEVDTYIKSAQATSNL